MKAFIEIRSQHAKGTWPKQGPDTYVAVQVVPKGQTRLSYLNNKVAQKRGIQIIYCGEGYRERCATNKSMLGQAKENAENLAQRINNFIAEREKIQDILYRMDV